VTPVRVDQIIPRLARRDAIGEHTVNLRDALRRDGFDSDIYYGSVERGAEHEGHPITALGRSGRDRWLLYQSSVGSPVFDIVAARSEPRLVNYHNITPAHLLAEWEPDIAFEVGLGRAQLTRLAGSSRLAVADSAFNQSELDGLGFAPTAVVPLLIDMHLKSEGPDQALLDRLRRRRSAVGGADLLFVGKVSPHKAPHDLVKMLAVVRRLYDPEARLHLVGSALGTTYEPALRAFIGRLGLEDAVHLTGSVNDAQLESYYQVADVFVCASEHEGFCVPVAEAMGHGIPVVAYAVTALPETVGQAGLLLPDKSPGVFAAAVGRVLDDDALSRSLAAAGRDRVAAFDRAAAARQFVALLRSTVAQAR
jgi:glycosyltransferase involved in cell wall biosynthesis